MQIAERGEEKSVRTEIGWDAVCRYCEEKKLGLAIWRLPNSTQTHVLISYQPRHLRQEQIEELPTGFLVGAFDTTSDNTKLFLPADVYFCFPKEEEQDIHSLLREKLPDFDVVTLDKMSTSQGPPPSQAGAVSFRSLVQDAIDTIQQGVLKKIVLARNKTVPLPAHFSLSHFWEKLGITYHNTFNSLIYLPGYGTWIGATPELLASKDAHGMFRTVALAGTQQTLGRGEKEAIWTQKEIEEQAYVRRNIIDCLKHIRLREFEDIGPKTIRVGHLFHLKTDFLVNTHEVDFPYLVSTMVGLLHPTAAVCGTPRKEALSFILAKEGFKRELYGGFLGPVNMQDETHLFVNLRCAKIQPSLVTFFAGAGVTEDSDPESEFMETENKMDSLLRLL